MKLLNKKDFELVKEQLFDEYYDEPWLLEIIIGSDSGGATVDVVVDSALYPENDPLPRMWNGVPFCVLKKPVIYHVDKDKLS